MFILLTKPLLGAILFGPEFNFSNHEILSNIINPLDVNSEESENAQRKFRERIIQKCSPNKCRVTEYKNRYGATGYRVSFNDSWYFQIETDPGAIEIQAKPTSLVDNIKLYDRYNEMIFNTATEIGLSTSNKFQTTKDWAGGHIHIGIAEAFNNDVRHFRNFIVDYTNHLELAHEYFANDKKYAPSIAFLSNEQKANFAKLVRETDLGKVPTIVDFATRLQKEVYFSNPFGQQAEKHQALNVMRIVDSAYSEKEKTIELRGLRAQSNAKVYLLEQRLFEKRIIYLKNRAPISLSFEESMKHGDRQKVEMFYKYVTESGLPFKDYEDWIVKSGQRSFYQNSLKSKNSNSCLLALSNYIN